MTDPAIPDTETIEGLRNELAAMTAERDAYRRGVEEAKRLCHKGLAKHDSLSLILCDFLTKIDKAMEPFK